MKLLILSVAMAFQFFAFASQSVCQEPKAQPDRPYLKRTEAPRLLCTSRYTGQTAPGGFQLVASKCTAGAIRHANRIYPPANRKC